MNSLQLQETFRNLDAYIPYKAGHVVFKEGEFGDVMYVLMEGLVDVVVQGRTVGTFEPIEIFGEMAVIDAGPRSATVVAKTDCKFISLNQKRFNFLVQQKPQFAIHIMNILVERIRWMDRMAASSHGTGTGGQAASETPRVEPPPANELTDDSPSGESAETTPAV